MHDGIGRRTGRRRPGVGGHVGRGEQDQLATEDLLIAGEGGTAVAGEGEVRAKDHRILPFTSASLSARSRDSARTGNSSAHCRERCGSFDTGPAGRIVVPVDGVHPSPNPMSHSRSGATRRRSALAPIALVLATAAVIARPAPVAADTTTTVVHTLAGAP